MESIALTAQGLRLRHLSDEAVLDRTLGGDPVAFGELYRRFRRRIERFCATRLNAQVAAEDAAQETFLRVLRASPQTIRNAEAWLFTVARNTCNDLMRKAQHLDEYVEDVEEFSLEELPVADTATELMRRQTARAVFLAMRRMPARYRTAIILREFHGMSSVEIAESMGISHGAVDPLVSRARDAFGVAYAEVSGFPEGCRAAVELIYRDLGSGIDATERAALDAHVHACPRCNAEQSRAHSPRYQHSIAPLIALGMPKLGVLAQALQHAAVAPAVFGGAHAAQAAVVAAVVGVSVLAGSMALGPDVQPAYRTDLRQVASGATTAFTSSHVSDHESTAGAHHEDYPVFRRTEGSQDAAHQAAYDHPFAGSSHEPPSGTALHERTGATGDSGRGTGDGAAGTADSGSGGADSGGAGAGGTGGTTGTGGTGSGDTHTGDTGSGGTSGGDSAGTDTGGTGPGGHD